MFAAATLRGSVFSQGTSLHPQDAKSSFVRESTGTKATPMLAVSVDSVVGTRATPFHDISACNLRATCSAFSFDVCAAAAQIRLRRNETQNQSAGNDVSCIADVRRQPRPTNAPACRHLLEVVQVDEISENS